MYFKTKFNPDIDICEVEPDLAIDLSYAIENGVVTDIGDNPVYNDIDDPASVSGRVNDPFEAVDVQKSILSRAAKAKSDAAAAAAAAATSTQTGAAE